MKLQAVELAIKQHIPPEIAKENLYFYEQEKRREVEENVEYKKQLRNLGIEVLL